MRGITCILPLAFFCCVLSLRGRAQPATSRPPDRQAYAAFAQSHNGNASHGKILFANEQGAACVKCHSTDGSSGKAGPDLAAIGDKFPKAELIRSVLEPSAVLAIGYSTTVVTTKNDEEYQGVLKQATDTYLDLVGADGQTLRIANNVIQAQRTSNLSLMPEGLEAGLSLQDFTDLIAYLESLRAPTNTLSGTLDAMPRAAGQATFEPFFAPNIRLAGPVWFGEVPGRTNLFAVLEHFGQSWLIERTATGDTQRTLVDLRPTVRTGPPTGLLGMAFHPQFATNRKYYLKYQIAEGDRVVTVLVERKFTADGTADSGEPARQLLKVPATTQDHNGGCIEFGPDGFLYLGMGDSGPQRDPQGHGQDLTPLLGKILRLDVDHTEGDLPYAIPADNPFRGRTNARPEIWAYGFREPWRFTFDRETQDLWVGDVGQDRIEEVGIVRRGENHGWNVFEGFEPFSNNYRRAGEQFVRPVLSYSHRVGVSVTGGYVYRGHRTPAMRGWYVCADFETRRVWALTQTNRVLERIVEIGRAPSRLTAFAQDRDGELYLVGYDSGVIYRLGLAQVDPTPLVTRVLLATSEQNPVLWRYSLTAPLEGWVQPEFDDAQWTEAPGGFGTRGTPGAVVRTEWRTGNIWLRREFTNSEPAQLRSLALRLHHDEDAEIYLNGVPAAQVPQWTSGYGEVPISAAAARTLHPGRNVLAIHCKQNGGGQYIDAGIVEYVKPSR